MKQRISSNLLRNQRFAILNRLFKRSAKCNQKSCKFLSTTSRKVRPRSMQLDIWTLQCRKVCHWFKRFSIVDTFIKGKKSKHLGFTSKQHGILQELPNSYQRSKQAVSFCYSFKHRCSLEQKHWRVFRNVQTFQIKWEWD